MTQALYLRPLGFLAGAVAEQAVADGAAGPLAGGPLAYTAVEVIEGVPGRSRSTVRRYKDLSKTRESALRALMDRVEDPRPPLHGTATDRPLVMGVVNVTPDSFSEHGLLEDPADAVAHGRMLIEQGADILDIGGESTRPGADPVPEEVELDRVMPVVRGLADGGVPISIDTRKPAVMRAAVAAGAAIVNDITALEYDCRSPATVRELDVPVVLMHSKGDPKTMQVRPEYDDVVLEVYDALASRIEACVKAGIPRSAIIADPGIGFGKTFRHNLEILERLSLLHGLGVPLVLGVSRKGFLGALTGREGGPARAAASIGAALA